MNICMITNDYPPICGGGGYHTYYLSQKLAKRGHKITIITRGSSKRTSFEEDGRVSIYRARFIMLPPFQDQVFGIIANGLFRNLEQTFDIVTLNGPIIPLINTRLPQILIEHVTARRFIDNLAPGSLFSLVFKLFSPYYVEVDKKTIKKADKIITASLACAQDIRKFYRLRDIDLETIPNGVDTSFFIPNDRPKQDKIVLFVGILGPIKGLNELIQSAFYIKQKHPDVKFVLAGSGPLENSLRELVHKLGLEDTFKFAGYLQRDALLKYYQNATVCVLPSWYEGGMSTTLLEAMSCEIPTIATSVGGNLEVVRDGETGLLVPPKNPEMLGQAISKILDNNILRIQMGQAARKIAKQHHDWNVITEKFEELYSSLLKKPAS